MIYDFSILKTTKGAVAAQYNPALAPKGIPVVII